MCVYIKTFFGGMCVRSSVCIRWNASIYVIYGGMQVYLFIKTFFGGMCVRSSVCIRWNASIYV